MAHTDAAKKHLRQTTKRTALNKAQKSRMRTLVKKAEAAIESGDVALAEQALKAACSALDRAAKKNIIHKNTANRKKSRLSKAASKAKAKSS